KISSRSWAFAALLFYRRIFGVPKWVLSQIDRSGSIPMHKPAIKAPLIVRELNVVAELLPVHIAALDVARKESSQGRSQTDCANSPVETPPLSSCMPLRFPYKRTFLAYHSAGTVRVLTTISALLHRF